MEEPLQTSSSIQSQVLPRLKGLSPKLRSAAEFVLAHPDEIATRTLRQVAKAADLTPPTFSRLARALDCETYDDLREICRGELKRRNQVLADKAQTLLDISSKKSPTDRSGVFFVQAHSAIDNIHGLMGNIDLVKLEEAAEILAHARKVVLVGTTSALALINYFSCMASMAFDNWQVAGASGAMWATQLSKLNSSDVVFAVSLEPHGSLPVQAMKIARDAGAKIIAVTDNREAPFMETAHTCFIVDAQSPQFFPSHVVPLLLIEGLMGMVVRRAGQKAANSIRSTEQTAHQLKEYWVDQ